MNLVARINGKVYEIEQGVTFAEEFNETLDSGVITTYELQEKIADMLPYDDVLIYSVDGKNDDGEYYYTISNQNYTFKGYPFSTANPKPKFYRHLLVDQFTEDVVNIDDSIFKYKIELMSETKKLETIQCSTISITQPLSTKKVDIFTLIKRYVDMFSPVYKEAGENNTWHFKKRYSIDETSLKPIFEGFYAKDFTETNGSLKDLLSKLFIMRDCIPYVKDDVIYAMEITKRGEKFRAESSEINRITGSRTSSNYADNLRRVYSDALSSEGTTRSVEYVGFRNSDNALVTLNNMRLELGMPIYRINKIYACYYKEANLVYFQKTNISAFNGEPDSIGIFQVYYKDDIVTYNNAYYKCIKNTNASSSFTPSSHSDYWEYLEAVKTNEKYWYLCQQDITPLVKLNTERNVLSQDWLDLTEVDSPKSIEEMAKFKFCTVGYNIGSNYITGWGERYTYPNKFYDTEYTVAENIISKVDYFTPYGDSSSFGEMIETDMYTAVVVNTQNSDSNTAIYSENKDKDKKIQSKIFLDRLVTPFSNTSLNLKGVFFIVDYQGFYNGTLTHSKDNERDDVTINDNASSPLTLLEADGVFQKSKANRFGNKSVQINARYDSFYDENGNENVQPLGSVYENDKYEDDIIIYHREYAIYDNFVLATYYGTKSYVLKNYYTSVSARYRTWNIMPYNESVKRVENRKKIFLLSKDTAYYEAPSDDDILKNFGEDKFKKIFSFFKSITQVNEVKGILNIEKPDQLNYGYIETYDEDGNVTKRVGSDINVFSSGNSLCVNLKMWDNFAQGVQINPNKYESAIGALKYTKEALVGDKNVLVATLNNIKETISPESFKTWNRANFNEAELYSGSQQQWIKLTDDLGKAKTLGFFVGHKDMSEYSTTSSDIITENEIINKYKQDLFYLPEIKKDDSDINLTNIIGNKFDLYKENKDCVDMTYQLEVVSRDSNVFVSEWMLKLSDLLANKNKFGKEVKIGDRAKYSTISAGLVHSFALGTRAQTETAYAHLIPVLTVAIDKNVSANFSKDSSKPSEISSIYIKFASDITPSTLDGGRADRIIFRYFIAQYAWIDDSNLYLIGELGYYRAETASADKFSTYTTNYIFKLGKALKGTSPNYNISDFFSADYTNKYDLYSNVSVKSIEEGVAVYDLLETDSSFNGSGTWLSSLTLDEENATCSYGLAKAFVDNQYNFPKISDSSGEITLPLVHSYNETIDGFNFCAFGNLNNFSYDQSQTPVKLQNFLTFDIITFRQHDSSMYVDKDNFVYSIKDYQTKFGVYIPIKNINRLYHQNLFVIKEPTYINKRTFIEEELYTDFYLNSIDNNISIQSQNGKQWIEIPPSMLSEEVGFVRGDNRVGSIQVWYVDDGERYKPSYTLTNKNGEKKQKWNGISYDNSIPVYTHFVFGVNLLENDVMPLREFTFVDNLQFTDDQSNYTLNMPFESNGEQFNQFKIRKDDNKYLMYYDDKLVSTTEMDRKKEELVASYKYKKEPVFYYSSIFISTDEISSYDWFRDHSLLDVFDYKGTITFQDKQYYKYTIKNDISTRELEISKYANLVYAEKFPYRPIFYLEDDKGNVDLSQKYNNLEISCSETTYSLKGQLKSLKAKYIGNGYSKTFANMGYVVADSLFENLNLFTIQYEAGQLPSFFEAINNSDVKVFKKEKFVTYPISSIFNNSETIIDLTLTANNNKYYRLKIIVLRSESIMELYYDPNVYSVDDYLTTGRAISNTVWNDNINYKTIKTRGTNSVANSLYEKTSRFQLIDYNKFIRDNIIANKRFLDGGGRFLFNYKGKRVYLDFEAYVKISGQIVLKQFKAFYVSPNANQSGNSSPRYYFSFIDENDTYYSVGYIKNNSVDFHLFENYFNGIKIKSSTLVYDTRRNDKDVTMWETLFKNLDTTLYPIKIYISSLSKKDPRVFDEYHQVIGKIKNIAAENDASNAKNLYTPNENK